MLDPSFERDSRLADLVKPLVDDLTLRILKLGVLGAVVFVTSSDHQTGH
jgi:hypothetical protein